MNSCSSYTWVLWASNSVLLTQNKLIKNKTRSFDVVLLLILVYYSVKGTDIVAIDNDLLRHVNVIVCNVLNSLDWHLIVGLLLLITCQLLLDWELSNFRIIFCTAWMNCLHWLNAVRLSNDKAYVITIVSRTRILRANIWVVRIN